MIANGLPESWASLVVEDAVESISTTGKKTPQKKYLESGRFPIVDQGQELIGGYTDDESKIVECEPPAIVFGDHTKVVKLVKQHFAPGADGVKVLKPHDFFDVSLFEFFLKHLATVIVDKGYARHYQHLAKTEIPLPPLNEQKRIVAKIEELFSEIDAGVASLQKARTQLGVYRQALLKKAFTGELTARWRAENPDQIELAEQLLERIRQEREARYQQQLSDWKTAVQAWEAGGKEGKKPTKPKKPKELAPILEPSIPTEWLAFPYGELCSIVRNGLSAKPSGNDGYKIARISAVRPMFFDYEDYRYLDCSKKVAESYALQTGDLIFTRYNGSRRYVGVCARYVDKGIRLFPDKLIQTRPDLPSLEAAYLELALNSGCSRAFIESKIRTTAGQSGVSGGDVKLTPVAICSLPEQKEIVRLLEAQFEAIEQNEREIDAALTRAEALRQSILKKAFSGQLVPQDPNDEPASVLLERIRQERKAATVKKPKKKAARSTSSGQAKKRARKKTKVE